MSLDHYYLLGRSGLRVSRLALGTMNFGVDGFHAAYGKSEEEARPIFRKYVEEGGNFVDTADFYTAGESERLIGKFIAETGERDRLVLTSKFTNSVVPGDPNAGGNGRKHMIRSVEASLRRLGTDYLDLFLLHTWDRITPVEEVLRTFDDLVRAGKIRYAGLSDVPAWYASRAQTLADAHSLPPMISLQLPYSLIERTIETEHVPAAQELGLGITAWSPLGSGFLSGKYRSSAAGLSGEGRLTGASGTWTAQQWELLKMHALDFTLPADLRDTLDRASEVPPAGPYRMFTPDYQSWLVNPGAKVGDKPEGYRPVVRNWVPAKQE